MKAYTIDSNTKEIKSIDIIMQADTVYSFFDSILTDELLTLNKHTIHADANAISKCKKAFFLGEQLIVGDALIVGKDGVFDTDATISKKELQSLLNYDVTPFYTEVLGLLKETDINLYRVFEVTKEQEDIQLNTEWVLYVFNLADEQTKEYFIQELKKAVDAKKDITTHMQNMAILALNATATN
ncbi:hypothetical protein M947_07465 [Sulfurimonas hongkongensis]|uniref:Uncharacterized protein n=1 Tax=Sulfurimonas hongkongensis TaxID=1172190 RepID=T0L0I4_9BACT|nr:hypothetical protein [Sulfurimonas hongkongensis]EQB39288.1 hypothetical protein M947_07465 [Sulfurimonas hongkongensis]